MTRSDAIARVHARLTASGYPRGVVLVIIALSGGIAFLFSAGLLALGLGQMGTRYFLATLVGYGTFLLLIRVWIASRRGFDDKVDVASDIANSVPDAGARVQVDEGLSQAIGYRAVHLVIRLEGLPVEVQVRTRFQHRWAELSEKLAGTWHDQRIKYGGGPEPVRNLLARLSLLVEEFEKHQRDIMREIQVVADIIDAAPEDESTPLMTEVWNDLLDRIQPKRGTDYWPGEKLRRVCPDGCGRTAASA